MMKNSPYPSTAHTNTFASTRATRVPLCGTMMAPFQ
jgi:hypothetical protein